MNFSLSASIAVLERTPQALRAMLAGLPAAWTEANEGGETWSPYVVVGHLVHTERTGWIQRAEVILAQDPAAVFAPVDRTAQFRESAGKSIEQLLDEFASLRSANVATLRAWDLADEQLALRAAHPAFGSVELRQLLATWMAHDLAHTAQIARTMARQYRDAVGPWRAYLSIMDR